MSSIDAAVRTSAPSGVPASRRSRGIRASTGNAVSDSAAPRNSANGPNGTYRPSTVSWSGCRYAASATPSTNGRAIEATETSAAARSCRRTLRRSRSQPTVNMKVARPTWPISRSTLRASGANRPVDGSPGSAPRSVGPRAMPATISPITRGCPMRSNAVPPSHAAARMTATSSRIWPLVMSGPSERRQRRLGRRAGLFVEGALGPAVCRVGLLSAVSDRGEADTAELREAAHHVEDDAGLARLVEVQAVTHRDVEQVVERQAAQPLVLEMVSRDQVLLAPARRDEQRGRRVVVAVGEELQGEEGMRGAALAQVELDRVRAPRAVGVADHDEVDGEAAQDAGPRQMLADLGRLLGDRAGIAEVGREAAAEVGLAARAAQELIVRGQELDVAQRRDAQLHARAPHLQAVHALLDDPAVLRQPAEIPVEPDVGLLERHRVQAARELLPLVGGSRRGQLAQVDDRVAAARDALVELDDRGRDRRAGRAHPAERVDHGAGVVEVLVADRVVDARLGEQPPAARLGAEREVHGIGAVQRYPEAEGEVALVRRGRVRNDVAAGAIGDQRPDLRQHTGALEQLLDQRAGAPVVRGHHVEPRPGLVRDHPREEREVVLHDALGHRPPGDVDDPHARLAQEQQQEQHALLERLQHRPCLGRVRRDRRHDDDRLARLVEAHRRPQRDEALLELGEAGAALALAEVAQPRRVLDQPGHARALASSSPTTLYAGAGLEKPRSWSFTSASTTAMSSIAEKTRWLMRICRPSAFAHRRAARFVTLPIAV